MPLNNLKNKTNAIRSFDWGAEAKGIVERHSEDLLNLQTSQLAQGINSAGERILPAYSEYTIENKRQHGVGLGAITDRVTYFNKGNLYRSLGLSIAGDKFHFNSPLFTFDKMIKRSGVKTVGLNRESRLTFINEITRPEIARIIKTKLGLTVK